MWTQRVQYAIRTLIVLAMHGNSRVSSRQIAEQYGIPRKYLETILVDLRQNGFVQSAKGKAGGYSLTRDPSRIRLSDVIGAFEPEWFVTGERSPSGGPARAEMERREPEEPVLSVLRERFLAALTNVTVADALMQWQQHRQTLNYSI